MLIGKDKVVIGNDKCCYNNYNGYNGYNKSKIFEQFS